MGDSTNRASPHGQEPIFPLSESILITTAIFSIDIYASLGIFTLRFLSASYSAAGGEDTIPIPIVQMSTKASNLPQITQPGQVSGFQHPAAK